MSTNMSRLTQLTLGWLQRGNKLELIEYLRANGNTQAQTDHWISYAAELTALEDETPESVIEAEVIMARMQERIR